MSSTSESVTGQRVFDYRDTPGAFPETVSRESVGISSQPSLTEAIHARRAEYVRPHTTRIKIGSWNVAAKPGVEKDIGGWFIQGKAISQAFAGLHVGDSESSNEGSESVAHQEARATSKSSTIPQNDQGSLPGGNEIGIYALGLQEVVDISSPTEALRPFTDASTAQRWKRAVADVLPPGYELVAEQQLVGLLLLVYASPQLASTVTLVSTSSVGTGLMGYMGNKGAVAARLVLGEVTRLVFVNSHLAAGAEKTSLERRNWDAAQVLSRTKFDPIHDRDRAADDNGDTIGDEDVAWWFGDLNYRIDGLPGEDVRRLLMLHARNEYDIGHISERQLEEEISKVPNITMTDRESLESFSSAPETPVTPSHGNLIAGTTIDDPIDPNQDPASLQTTLACLLPHDQLHQQQAAGRILQDGWREGPITFLPTYKYDIGSVGMFDSGEKKRGPSWCDRILFRTRRNLLEYQAKVKEGDAARKRDEELRSRGVDAAAAEDEDVLFDYDPETDGQDEDTINHATVDHTANGANTAPWTGDERVQLEAYTSHQRVLSSDHKPLVAIFTLHYDAVVPALKAQVHQEVVRELDKVENEGRPGVTIVVEHQHDEPTGSDQSRSANHSESSESVNFGQVRFKREKTRGVTIANTSQVPAKVSFVEQPGKQGDFEIAPPWLSVMFDGDDNDSSKQIDLEPGEAINVGLNLRIDEVELVRELNAGREQLDCVLVLRVADGRDHFLPVRSTWMQSCFGRSLDELIALPEGGVRALGAPSAGAPLSKQKRRAAPKELVHLTESIEALAERVIAEWSMTDTKENRAPWENYVGWPFKEKSRTYKDSRFREIDRFYVQEALDTGREACALFPLDVPLMERLEVVAEVLVDFLASLKDGVVTEALWAELELGVLARERAKQTLSTDEERAWVLDVLATAPTHSVCFVFLTAMLARVASEVAPLHRPADVAPPGHRSPAMPASPKGRRRTLSHDPIVARRQVVDEGYAKIFARAMVRGSLPTREKDRAAAEERRRSIVEVFLRGKWEQQQ